MQRRPGNALRRGDNLPKVIRLIRILDNHIPTDALTSIIPIVSLRGMRGHRIKGTTEGRDWEVELFGGNFYRAKVSGYQIVIFHTPLHVVNFLRSHLPRP